MRKSKRRISYLEVALLVLPMCGLALASWCYYNRPEPVVPPRYRVKLLDIPAVSEVIAMNDQGDVVGFQLTDTNRAAMFVTQSGRIRRLASDSAGCMPVTINNRGDVAGYCSNAKGERHGFFWRNGEMRILPTLGGKLSVVKDMNDEGDIVGFSETKQKDWIDNPVQQAFLWTNGRMHNLTPASEQGSYANTITNEGLVLGSSSEGYTVWQGTRQIYSDRNSNPQSLSNAFGITHFENNIL